MMELPQGIVGGDCLCTNSVISFSTERPDSGGARIVWSSLSPFAEEMNAEAKTARHTHSRLRLASFLTMFSALLLGYSCTGGGSIHASDQNL
jgi:hypothetical protein